MLCCDLGLVYDMLSLSSVGQTVVSVLLTPSSVLFSQQVSSSRKRGMFQREVERTTGTMYILLENVERIFLKQTQIRQGHLKMSVSLSFTWDEPL